MWREEQHNLADQRNSMSSSRCSAGRRRAFLFVVLLIINRIVFTETAYQRSKCEHHFVNYSLEWAFEPQLKNMVFVLRTAVPDRPVDDELSHASLWPAVAFGSRQNDSFLEILGIVPSRESPRLVTAFIDTSMGTLGWHSPISAYDAARQIAVGVDASSNMIVAKFSHKISGDSNGCMTLNIPEHEPTLLQANRPINIDKLFKPLIVCEIGRYCIVDTRQLHNKDEEIQPKKSAKSNVKEEKKLRDDEVAHSVDISGTGDPCSFAGIGYTVNWTYNRASDCVDFVMHHPVKKGKWWSAVGIGDTMADMDIGVVFLENGQAKKIIDYFSSSYTVPDIDSHQDWILHGRKSKIIPNVEHDVVELYFSRKIDTTDTEKDRSMDGCVLFQFAANSGRYGTGFKLRKHDDWPDLYKACDLKTRCLSTAHHPHETEDIVELGESLDESGLNSTTILDSRKSSANETDIVENVTLGGEDTPDAEDSRIISILSEKSQNRVEKSDVIIEPGQNSTILESEEDDNDLIGSTNETSVHFAGSQLSKYLASTLPPPNNSPTITNVPHSTVTSKAETTSDNIVTSATAPQSSTTTIAIDTLSHSTPHTDNVERRLIGITSSTHSTKSAESNATIEEITHTRPMKFTILPPNDNLNSVAPSIASTSGSPSTKHQSTSTSSQTKKSTTVSSPTKPKATLTMHSASTSTSTRSGTTIAPTTSPTTINSAKPVHPTEPRKSNTELTKFISTSATKSTSASTKPETKPTVKTISDVELETHGLFHTTQSPSTPSDHASTSGTKSDGCDPSKPDLDICEKYMTDYFARVKVWADNNRKPMEKQYGKACYLLGEVKNVPTMCCHIFNDKCAGHL